MKHHPYLSAQPPVFVDSPAHPGPTAESEWIPLPEAMRITGGSLVMGSRLLINGRPAVFTLDPYIGSCSGKYTDTPDSYALNIRSASGTVLVHTQAIRATQDHMAASQA